MYISLIIFSANASYLNTATHLFIDVLDDDEPITYEPGNKKRRKSFSDVLMVNQYKNAKMSTADKTTNQRSVKLSMSRGCYARLPL